MSVHTPPPLAQMNPSDRCFSDHSCRFPLCGHCFVSARWPHLTVVSLTFCVLAQGGGGGTHGGRKTTQVGTLGQWPMKNPDAMLWNLLMSNGGKCLRRGHPAQLTDHLEGSRTHRAHTVCTPCIFFI